MRADLAAVVSVPAQREYSVTFVLDGNLCNRKVRTTGMAQAVEAVLRDFEQTQILSVVDVTPSRQVTIDSTDLTPDQQIALMVSEAIEHENVAVRFETKPAAAGGV